VTHRRVHNPRVDVAVHMGQQQGLVVVVVVVVVVLRCLTLLLRGRRGGR